jgi:hypothetical protein
MKMEYVPEFQESKIFIEVNLTCQYWIAGGLCQTGQVHLLIKELHGFLLGDPERYIANVKASRLSRDGRAHDRYGRLWGVCNYIGGDLTGRLHGLVLKRGYVFEARRRYIPIERGLTASRRPGSSTCCGGSGA